MRPEAIGNLFLAKKVVPPCLPWADRNKSLAGQVKMLRDASAAARGLLRIDDPKTAASHFNWLVMSEPLNRAMLLGDGAIPKPAALRRHVAESVRVFLAAYGSKSGHPAAQ